jgi:hypothetical protein
MIYVVFFISTDLLLLISQLTLVVNNQWSRMSVPYNDVIETIAARLY